MNELPDTFLHWEKSQHGVSIKDADRAFTPLPRSGVQGSMTLKRDPPRAGQTVKDDNLCGVSDSSQTRAVTGPSLMTSRSVG